ncbi:hypothetical protein BE15_19930 [Sorangium cellulosum]|uniref:Uncharacterized protein n=1 Tax=Sorangium cellulosum TaxID=56 RepID=A0A150Q6U3_SORCE|nr:hypothetical protein BE15_19930 [Sorangium cellulosum]
MASVYWIAIICCSGGALGWIGPLDPSGTGRGGISRLGASLAVGVAAALADGAAGAAEAVEAVDAPGAGARGSSHARTARPRARTEGAARRARGRTGAGCMGGLYER